MKVLVLYRELAAYLVECLNKLAAQAEITLVHYPINPEAPFEFELDQKIKAIEKGSSEYDSFKKLNHNFSHVLVSGWADNEYNAIAYKIDAIRVLAFDTQWNNSLKFQLGSLYLKWKFAKNFDYAFIPGSAQIRFAEKLGFVESHIKTGFYTANDHFDLSAAPAIQSKQLWCVARYIPQKNLTTLWKAFAELTPNERSGWTLHCAGSGEMFDERIEAEGIFHHGFLQPSELADRTKEASAFVLPSLYEPWGVVVHEWAKMKKPYLLSSQVGAASDLLEAGKNGYAFSPFHHEELKQALINLFQLPASKLIEMGEHSYRLSKKFSSDHWVDQLIAMK